MRRHTCPFSPLLFVSVPPRLSPHDKITAEAARRAGWPGSGLKALQAAVRAPDLEEMRWLPRPGKVASLGLDGAYEPAHHADRVPGVDDADAFQAVVGHVRTQMAIAHRHLEKGVASGALEALGRALHAAQDCLSHSNTVELGPDAVRQVRRAFREGVAAPEGLRLTAVDPAAPEPGRVDDAYAHDLHAKDGPDQTPEASRRLDGTDKTAYEAAVGAAVLLTADLLEAWLEDVDRAGRARLAEASRPKVQWWRGPVGRATAWTGLGLIGTAALVVAWQRRSWRP